MRCDWVWGRGWRMAATFKCPHHRRIALVLSSLDAALLRKNRCLFAGGTVIAMRYGEYRESVDIDFLVSDWECYRNLRQLMRSASGLSTILRAGSNPLILNREIRMDQYGIRTELEVDDQPIKFEIVYEARIELSASGVGDEICSVATLTPLDMAASKLLANSDRWADDSVFSRDVIDLAMMNLPTKTVRQAMVKAEAAYGEAVRIDLERAITRLMERENRLERCMEVMAMDMPKAQLWARLRSLRSVLT